MNKEYELIIFDADGTLRSCTVEGQACPNDYGQWRLMPGAIDKLAQLTNTRFAVASNQGGVAFGYLTLRMASGLLHQLVSAIAAGTARDLYSIDFYMCPHHSGGVVKEYAFDCSCRKPKPGMLYQAMIEHNVAPSKTLMVGDMDSDREAAEAAGIDFMWAQEFFGWE